MAAAGQNFDEDPFPAAGRGLYDVLLRRLFAQHQKRSSCPRFWLHALNCSGRSADILAESDKRVPKAVRIEIRQLVLGCVRRLPNPALAKASRKIVRMGDAVLQCSRSRPDDSNWRVAPSAMRVAGNRGSSFPQTQPGG